MITIHHVDGTELYHRYPNQAEPQPCHVELNLRASTLTAAYDPEMGSGAPEAVLHGHTRRFAIPALKGDAANALLERIAPLAEHVAAGYSTRWTGHVRAASFSAAALAALDEVEALCDATFAAKDAHLVVERAEDWFRPTGSTLEKQARFVGIARTATDIDLDRRAAHELRGADVHGVDVIDGLDEYLRRLREAARDAA